MKGGVMVDTKDLKEQVLFEDLTEEEIKKIIPIVEGKKFRKDEVIFKEKQPANHLRMIKKGKIEISKTTPDGWKQTLAVLGNNTFFGELALLEKREHQAVARAVDDTEVFFIKKDNLEEFEQKEPMIMLKIYRKIAIVSGQNVRRMNQKLMNALVSY